MALAVPDIIFWYVVARSCPVAGQFQRPMDTLAAGMVEVYLFLPHQAQYILAARDRNAKAVNWHASIQACVIHNICYEYTFNTNSLINNRSTFIFTSALLPTLLSTFKGASLMSS